MQVSLPGVKRDTFLCFLEYLYTDSVCPHVPVDVGVSVIELANRLCLTRLINLLESTLINVFAQKQSHGIDVIEDCIKILESSTFKKICINVIARACNITWILCLVTQCGTVSAVVFVATGHELW